MSVSQSVNLSRNEVVSNRPPRLGRNRCGYLLVLVKILNIYIHETGNGINFPHSYGNISVMLNISKMLSMQVRQETVYLCNLSFKIFSLFHIFISSSFMFRIFIVPSRAESQLPSYRPYSSEDCYNAMG